MNRFPEYDQNERIADLCIHVAGVVLGTVAVGNLAIIAQNKVFIVGFSLIVYGFSLFAMLASSALYNLVPASPRKAFLRRVDHAAIYVMIAGTYTPLALNPAPPDIGIGLFLFVWIVAAMGVGLKLAYPWRYEAAAIVLYLVLGWCFLPVADELFAVLPQLAILLLLGGGLLYTAGVAVHHWRGLRYHNVIWHALVLIAAGCHYAAILNLFNY